LVDIENDLADGLVVAKLDRLSRSVKDFADLMDRSRRKGWALVALDLGVDTTTPAGEAMASVLAVFAQFERRMIGLRTKEGLAVRRSQGVRLGRPPVLQNRTVRRIKRLRTQGHSLSAIARRLTNDGTPTAHGGKRWYPSSVKAVLDRVADQS
jgi:DNA invertase Pin-like site-specific DNA recombinase